MFLTTVLGISTSYVVADLVIDFFESKLADRGISIAKFRWKNHRLKSFVRDQINLAIKETSVDEATEEIFSSKTADYLPIKEGFYASIFRKDAGEDETWFVKSPPCILSKLKRIHEDFGNLLSNIRGRLWNNDRFSKFADNKLIQQIIMDEVDSVNKRLKEIEGRVQNLEYEVQHIRKELASKRFTVVENAANPVNNFSGRERLLAEIAEKLEGDRIVFLTGFGGIGKSELARAFARRFKEDERNKAVWVTYDGDLKRTIAKIQFGNIDDSVFESDLDKLFEVKMAALSYEQNLLIVVDNYEWNDDLDCIDGIQCRVLFTTRYSDIPSVFGSVCVSALDQEESLEVIRKSAGSRERWVSDHKEEILSVLSKVDYHTLTVTLIAGLIASVKGLESLDLGGRILKISDSKVYSKKDGKIPKDSVRTHITNLFDSYGLSDEEWDVLRMASLLPIEGMGYSLFGELSESEEGIIEKMVSLNLLNLNSVGEKTYISMHPLIKEVIIAERRPCMIPEEEDVCSDFIFNFNEFLNDQIVDSPNGLKECLYLLPSFESFASDATTWKECAEMSSCMLMTIWSVYEVAGYYSEAMRCADNALETGEAILGKGHQYLLVFYHNVGIECNYLGRYEEALEYHMKALDIVRNGSTDGWLTQAEICAAIGVVYQNLGKIECADKFAEEALDNCGLLSADNPRLPIIYRMIGQVYNSKGEYVKALEYYEKAASTLKTDNNSEKWTLAAIYSQMGTVCCNMGRYTDAIGYNKKQLELEKASLPPDHPEIATAYHDIGESYRKIGAYGDALDSFNEAIRIRETQLPSESLYLAKTYVDAGDTYMEMGLYEESFNYITKGIALCKEVLPDDHPILIGLYHDLGLIYCYLGKYQEAEMYQSKVLEYRIETLPANHPDLAIAYCNLGITYVSIGQYEKATEYFREALKVIDGTASTDSPVLASVYSSLGLGYSNMGLSEESIGYYEKSLEIRERILPPGHPDIVLLYGNLGTEYMRLGRYDEALELLEKALDMAEDSNNTNLPRFSDICSKIGLIYDGLGSYDEAMMYHEKAVRYAEQSLQPDHPNLIMIYTNIGTSIIHTGRYDEALSYFFKALDICKIRLPEYHPDIATIYDNIGVTCTYMGKREDSLEWSKMALQIKEKVLPENHLDLAIDYDNVGSAYRNLGNFEEALKYHQKALEIREKNHQTDHPHLAYTYCNLGIVYRSLGDYENSLPYLEKSLEIREKILPTGHPDIKAAYGELGWLYVLSNKKEEARVCFLKNMADREGKSLVNGAMQVIKIYSEHGDFDGAKYFLDKTIEMLESEGDLKSELWIGFIENYYDSMVNPKQD